MNKENALRKDGYVLYKVVSDETNFGYDYILERWGGSTKHPDSICKFSRYNSYMPEWEPEYQLFQWLLECRSIKTWDFHAYSLAKWRIELYENDTLVKWAKEQ